MRYPKYPDTAYADPAAPLIDAYVGYLKAYEQSIMPPDLVRQQQINELPVGDTRRSAFLIGRACLLGKKGNEAEKRLSRRAHTEITPSANVIGDRIRAVQQRNIAKLIEGRDDERRIAQVRANMHDAAIDTLKRSYNGTIPMPRDDTSNKGRGLGARGEARAVAFLTRLNHPWLFAAPALEHHDRHEFNNRDAENKQYNFDILGVESLPPTFDDPGPHIFKAQVKSHCFGLCSIPDSIASTGMSLRRHVDLRIEGRRQFQYERSLYNPDISLLSACCDFKPRVDDTLGSIDRLLINEHTGKVTDDDIDTLNMVSNNVLLTLTGDPLRKGTFESELADLSIDYAHA